MVLYCLVLNPPRSESLSFKQPLLQAILQILPSFSQFIPLLELNSIPYSFFCFSSRILSLFEFKRKEKMAITHADLEPSRSKTDLSSKTGAFLMVLTILLGLLCFILCLIADATRSEVQFYIMIFILLY